MTILICPLCSQSRFDTLEALRNRLVTAATQNITCPICSDQLLGLDKFTIHLFGHALVPVCPERVAEEKKEEIPLEEALSTVNMEDLSFLTSWDSCGKITASEKVSLPEYSRPDTPKVHHSLQFSFDVQQSSIEGPIYHDHSTETNKNHNKTLDISKNIQHQPRPIGRDVGTMFNHDVLTDNSKTVTIDYRTIRPLPRELQQHPDPIKNQTRPLDISRLVKSQPRPVERDVGTMFHHDVLTESSKTVPTDFGRTIRPPTRESQGAAPVNNLARSLENDRLVQSRDASAIFNHDVLTGSSTTDICMTIRSLPKQEVSPMFRHDGPTEIHENAPTDNSTCSTVQDPPRQQRDILLQVQQTETTPKSSTNTNTPTLLFNAAFLETPGDSTRIFLQPISFLPHRYEPRRHTPQPTEEPLKSEIVDPGCLSTPQSPESQITAESVQLSEYMSELLKDKMVTQSNALEEVKETCKCDTCGLEVENAEELVAHKELVHGLQKDLYVCKICGRGYKMRGSLFLHARVAHGGFNGESTSESSTPAVRSYHCTQCSKSFKKEQHLTQHAKTHDGKQWQCETCSKYFTTVYFLKKHRRLHTGEMPYHCETCQKKFTFQQSYHKHLLYHSEDKPHGCPDCGRSFKELSTLHNHQRIHSGEKPFACETCGKCFRQRVSYIVHQRIHSGELPYQCTACKKKFRYKLSQRSHKCAAQPPGVVVRQPGDLAQRILQHRQNILKCQE